MIKKILFIPFFISIIIYPFKNQIAQQIKKIITSNQVIQYHQNHFLLANFDQNEKEFYEVDETNYENNIEVKNQNIDPLHKLIRRLESLEKKISKIETDLLQIKKFKFFYKKSKRKDPKEINDIYQYEKNLKNKFEENIRENVNISKKINYKTDEILYKIHAGAFNNYKNAVSVKDKIYNLGIPSYINQKVVYSSRQNNKNYSQEPEQQENNDDSNYDNDDSIDDNYSSYTSKNKKKQQFNNDDFADITYFLMYDSYQSRGDDNNNNKPIKKSSNQKYLRDNNQTKNPIDKIYRIISEKNYHFREANKIIQMLSTLGYKAYIKKI